MPTQLSKSLVLIGVIAASLIFGRMIAQGGGFVVIGIVLSLAVGLITFLRPEYGLIALVFSMLLSPEIIVGGVPGREVTLRVDDFLLIAVFIAYIAYHAVNFQARKFIKTPIDSPLLALIVVYFASTGLGIIEGRLHPVASGFFVVKYIQYYVLYWLTANIINSEESVKKVLIAGTLTAIVVSIYAYSLFPTVERVYAPFDVDVSGKVGEAASLGGYYLIIFAFALSFFMNHESKQVRYFSLGLFLFMFPPFVRTLSRASYYALGALIPALVFFSPKRKKTLLLGTLFFIAIAPLVAPSLTSDAIGRLQETFTGPVSDLGIDLELSAAARVDSWIRALTVWFRARPILGHGVTGVGLVDAQFPRIIGELGLSGSLIFIWLIFSIFKSAKSVLAGAIATKNDLQKSLATGFLAALVGLLVQSVGVNTFIIVRIMTPFWFLAALVMSMKNLSPEKNKVDTQ